MFLRNWMEDMMSAFSSVMSPEDWSTSDSDSLSQMFSPFYEDDFPSYYSSDSGTDIWLPWALNDSDDATNATPDRTEAGSRVEVEARDGSGAEAEADEQ